MGFLGISIPNPFNAIEDLVKDVEHLASDVASGNLMGALGDMGSLAGEISGSSELAALAQSVGTAVGLPKAVTDAIKVGIGAATGDITSVLAGAIDGLEQGMQGAGATNYVPCQDPSTATSGYAPATSSKPDEELSMFQYLQQHFDAFEQSSPIPWHRGDNRIGTEEFQAIAGSNDAPAEMKRVARYFLDHADAMADVAKSDGGIVPQDIQLAIEDRQQELASGCAPTGSSSSSSGCDPVDSSSSAYGNQIDDILNNPAMSLEEKIMAILMLVEEQAEKNVQNDIKDLASKQKKNEGVRNDGDAKDGDKQAAQDDVSNATTQLQRDSDRINQLNSLMSNIEKMFNDMKMTSIRNIGQ